MQVLQSKNLWEMKESICTICEKLLLTRILIGKSKTNRDINKSLQFLKYKHGPCLHPSSLNFSTKSRDLHHLYTPWPNIDFPCMWRSRKTGPVHHQITFTLEMYIHVQCIPERFINCGTSLPQKDCELI